MKIMLYIMKLFLFSQACLYCFCRFFTRTRFTFADSNLYVPSNPHLLEQFTRQKTEASCSVAAFVTLINAIRKQQYHGKDGFRKITQETLLFTVRAENWRERVSASGYQGRRGVPFDQLIQIMAETVSKMNLPVRKMRFARLSWNMKNLEYHKKKFFKYLNYASGNSKIFILIHFNQGALINTWHVPHISLIGGVDPSMKRVLVLDVDPDVQSNYLVYYSDLFKAMSWKYLMPLRNRGFTSGGYIIIETY